MYVFVKGYEHVDHWFSRNLLQFMGHSVMFTNIDTCFLWSLQSLMLRSAFPYLSLSIDNEYIEPCDSLVEIACSYYCPLGMQCFGCFCIQPTLPSKVIQQQFQTFTF